MKGAAITNIYHLTGAAHAVFSSKFWLSAQPLVYRTIGFQNNRLTELNIAASTLRRWLPRMGIVWRRPVIKDPAYQEKMANIEATLAHSDADNPVFYGNAVDVDIDLNPKLGADWMFRAQQKLCHTG